MITNVLPVDWRDLQNKVSQLLNESGIEAEAGKKIEHIRGTVEIDVFAREIIDNRNYDILIECKNWSSNVPQTVIHGFRSVISDIGANIGYIISLKGFQSGAYEAKKFTNINILTWYEFQKLFEEKWLRNYFSEYIEKHFGALMTYAEPLVPNWAMELNDQDSIKFVDLHKKYEDLGWLLLSLRNITGIFSKKDKFPNLPLEKGKYNIPEKLYEPISYRELLNILHEYCDPAINEYKKLRNSVINK